MGDVLAAVFLALSGAYGAILGVGAWTGRYRMWANESWWYGRSVTYLIPGGIGAVAGSLGLLLKHTAIAVAARPLGFVAGALFAVCMVLFFTQPKWAIPRWLRDLRDR